MDLRMQIVRRQLLMRNLTAHVIHVATSRHVTHQAYALGKKFKQV